MNAPRINNPLNDCLHFAVPFKEEFLHVFLVYIHPTLPIEENIFAMAARMKYSLIIGDFNVNNPTKRKQLNRLLVNANFSTATTPPTFIMTNNADSTPDLIIYSNNISNNICEVDCLPDLGSDHLSIKLTIDFEQPLNFAQQHRNLNFKKANIARINADIMKYLESVSQLPITPFIIDQFNDKLSEAVLHNSPSFTKPSFNYTLPPYIVKLIKQKRKLYRQYKTILDPEIKKAINNLGKNIHQHIQQHREHIWMETCEKINETRGKKFYQQVNKLSKYCSRSRIPVIEEGGRDYNTDQEKADLFARTFAKQFQISHHPDYDKENFARIESWYEEYFQNPANTEVNLREEDYFNMLTKQKNSCPGSDHIPWNVIKALDYDIHLFIMKMLEYCISKNHFPAIWKKGQIIVIPKPYEDQTKARNYRPITLLPCIGKMLEKIIKCQINTFIGDIIPTHQFGFRSKCSTLHPLTVLVSNVQAAKLNNFSSAALLLDIRKAFDSVWHKGLLYKLKRINLPDHLIHIVKSFLLNRQLQVKINNNISMLFSASQGVPQGSPLSPLLYNIFCYDMHVFRTPTLNSNHPAYVLQYADDTALLAHGKSLQKTISKVQDLTDATADWLNRWRLQANPTKSQLLIFNHKINNNSPSITLNNHKVKPTPSSKYLGMYIDQKLTFRHHSQLIKKKIKTRAKFFRALTYRKKGINLRTAAHIYKTICRPMLEYGHSCFINCPKATIKNLQVAETSSLRIITKMRHPDNPLHNPANRLLYSSTRIQPIVERLKKLTCGFVGRSGNMASLEPLLISRNPNIRPKHKFPKSTIKEHLEEIAAEAN